MAVIKFELKEEHLLLIKNLNFDVDIFAKEGDEIKIPKINELTPFGLNHMYEDMSTILEGPRDVLGPEDDISFFMDEDKKQRYDKLLVELPIALDIVLTTQSFELGMYKTKSHFKNWVKI